MISYGCWVKRHGAPVTVRFVKRFVREHYGIPIMRARLTHPTTDGGYTWVSAQVAPYWSRRGRHALARLAQEIQAVAAEE